MRFQNKVTGSDIKTTVRRRHTALPVSASFSNRLSMGTEVLRVFPILFG
jgi:hypothetical protein